MSAFLQNREITYREAEQPMALKTVHNITTLSIKEFKIIIRDHLTLVLAFIAPFAAYILFIYGLSMDVKNIPLGLINQDKSTISNNFIERMTKSGYFKICDKELPQKGGLLKLNSKCRGTLWIPAHFSERLRNGRSPVFLAIDGTYPLRAQTVAGYMSGMVSRFNLNINPGLSLPIHLEVRSWFNEGLESKNFIVPGTLVATLMFYPALLSVLSLVGEKESGSIINLKIAPISRFSIIMGKSIPYTIISFISALMMFAFALLIGIPFRGSIVFYLLMLLLYVASTVQIGIFISNLTKSSVSAVFITSILTILPAYLYSGFFIPINSMGESGQIMSYLSSARAFMRITRAEFLKGSEFSQLADPLYIVFFLIILFVVNIFLFRKR